MNATLADAIAEGLAGLERVQATPTGDLGYGVDVVCMLDLDPNMAETDPASPVGIGQSTVRRWDCPRGELPPDGKDAQDYGISLRSYVNTGTTQRDLNALKTRLEAEALKDDRIAAIKVSIANTTSGALVSLRVSAVIQPRKGGPFELVLAVTSATIVIESIAGVSA